MYEVGYGAALTGLPPAARHAAVLYDSTNGKSWSSCSDAREDPCGACLHVFLMNLVGCSLMGTQITDKKSSALLRERMESQKDVPS